jgi:hypothetical protein
MARAVGKSFKVDVALPTDIYNVVAQMAINADAPIHHKSGQRILTPSILQLLRIGIQSLSDSPDLADTNILSLSNTPDSRISKLLDRVRILEDKPINGDLSPFIDRVTEIARNEVELALSPLSNDLLTLQAQLAKLTANRDNWDDLRADVADLRELVNKVPAQIEALRAQITAIGEKPATAPAKQPAASGKPKGEVHNEVLKVANRLEREPALKSAVIDGLAAGHTGEKLGQYLMDKGFVNGNGGKYTGASNSRFRLAIEHLKSQGIKV